MGRSKPHGGNAMGNSEISKGRLLLVEQNAQDLQRYATLLDTLGYDVHAFSSYGEAAECLQREMFDMVVVSPGEIHI